MEQFPKYRSELSSSLNYLLNIRDWLKAGCLQGLCEAETEGNIPSYSEAVTLPIYIPKGIWI